MNSCFTANTRFEQKANDEYGMQTVLKAVVVEDNHDVQFQYRFKLEQAGFEVKIASDGQEGLDVIREFEPDVVLLDLMMPVMDGAEMLTQMRAQDWGSKARVVILTNLSRDEAPQTLRFLNVDRYVVKAHHTPAQVTKIVHEVLK